MYQDIAILPDLAQEFPGAKTAIIVKENTIIDWNIINGYRDKLNIVFNLYDMNQSKEVAAQGYKWFWHYSVDTWYQLEGVLQNNPSEIIIGDLLFFNVEKTYQLCHARGITLRLVPNFAFDGYIPRVNGINGIYVRPEDLKLYEPYVTMCEFFAKNLSEEHALFEVYKRGVWNGNLNLLITNLNYNIDNRVIPSVFGTYRLNCNHKCSQNNLCHLCYQCFDTVTKLTKKVENGEDPLER